MDNQTLERLTSKAKDIRSNIVEMIGAAKSGHPGGSLSVVEMMTYLYFEEMNIDPLEGMLPRHFMPCWPREVFSPWRIC